MASPTVWFQKEQQLTVITYWL